ncbi:hypothetical protein GCM10023169_22690 [Georgenia halophila]|uniref:Uncharacterized protein n=1 Tax=Georgenia halophila TaxID=620889 RepID=A0ABP8LAF8_9MICO
MWWVLWVMLVLAAAGALVLLALNLWRRSKAIGREMRELSRALERLGTASVGEHGRHRSAQTTYLPGPVRDAATLAAARATRERVAAERDEARGARLARAVTRWRSVGLVDQKA